MWTRAKADASGGEQTKGLTVQSVLVCCVPKIQAAQQVPTTTIAELVSRLSVLGACLAVGYWFLSSFDSPVETEPRKLVEAKVGESG